MKFKSTGDATEFLHMFLYGDGGCGKTRAIGDFHLAGVPVVLVSTEVDGAIPLRSAGAIAPHLMPESGQDFMDCVLKPRKVIEEVIWKQPGFEGYEPKLWAFDGLRALQRLILADLMKEPGNRPGPGVPSNLDYRVLDLRMRNAVAGIEQMPYHTIITAHYEKDFSIETKLELTGDQKTDKDVVRRSQGYPSLEGFTLKYDLPNLCSSFYLFLTERNRKYEFHTTNTPAAKARTRIAEVIPPTVDWSSKNMFLLLQEMLDKAANK